MIASLLSLIYGRLFSLHNAVLIIVTVMLLGSSVGARGQMDYVPLVRSCLPDSFVPDTKSMGEPSLRYIDPEVLIGTGSIAFQDEDGNLWFGKLDPTTGKFVSPTGRDVLVDTNLASVQISHNGPEWGLDRFGPALFYTKPDNRGTQQIWRAGIAVSEGIVTKQLTTGILPSVGQIPSLFAGNDETYILFFKGMKTTTTAVWAKDSSANSISPVPNYWLPSGGGFFVPGPAPDRPFLLFVHKNEETLETQVALLDTVSGQMKLITNDAGDKYEPHAFNAPEYGGEMLIAVLIDRLTLAIYRNIGDANGYWTRIEEISLPEGETNTWLYSMEPVSGLEGQSGINGVSYFSLAANQFDNPYLGDTSLWLLGLGNNPDGRFCRRVDEGSIPDRPQFRFEPETYLGSHDLFYFYNENNPVNPLLGQTRVVKTGINF